MKVIRIDRTALQEMLTVDCFTWDKMSVETAVAVQYAYDRTKIVPVVFKLFADRDNYEASMKRNMTSLLMWTCAKFNATDYYDFRGMVEKQMQLDMEANMNTSNSRSAVVITLVQLKNIQFPAEFVAMIAERQLIEQQRITALNNRPNALTQANTTSLTADQQAAVILTNYDNQARVVLTAAAANSQVILSNWIALINVLQTTKTIDGFNNTQAIAFLNQDTLATKQMAVQFSVLESSQK